MLWCDVMLQVTAAKGKQGGSKGREASPALQPTRVSKRQKAKAEAQAADTAQEEEEQTPDEDPFIGAATQVGWTPHVRPPSACSLNHL